MRRWVVILLGLVVTLIVAVAALIYTLAIWPQRVKHPPLVLGKGNLAIEHARIYISPDEPVIADGTIVIHDGRIAAVGAGVAVPADAMVIPCDRCVVTAGFWNAHVHFTEPKWSLANWKSAPELNAFLADMLTSRGFTTVVDTGSNYLDTIPLRRRIESGELAGPYVYTAEGGLYPPHGIPFYLRENMPGWLLHFMAQPETPQAAEYVVKKNIDAGADITKLFTGSWVERGRVLPMPVEIAKAAAEESHQRGKLVFSHPSNLQGVQVAMDSGVDVLAHVPDDTKGIVPGLFQTMVQRNMAMIPTLKMFTTTVTSDPHYMEPMREEVREFQSLGGQLIFGTDVGYMTDYTTEGEYAELAKCGLTAPQILAMLTTNPASRFGVLNSKGTITAGKLADLTILDADPAQDLDAFAKVRTTIRSGRVIYQR